MSDTAIKSPLTVLRLKQVKSRVGLGRSSIYLGIAKGTFPRQIRLGARAVGWIESEVAHWLTVQIEKSRDGAT